MLEQSDCLFDLPVCLICTGKLVLVCKPIGMVLSQAIFTDFDDMLEQSNCLFDLPVCLIRTSKGVLGCKPIRMVLG